MPSYNKPSIAHHAFRVRSYTADTYLQTVLSRYAKPGDPIVELGCSSGNNLLPLAKQGYLMYGVDIADNRLQELQKEAKKQEIQTPIKLEQWDFGEHYSLPWPDMQGRFKGMVIVHVLSHFSDDKLVETVQNLKQYLAPGAPIVCTLLVQNKPPTRRVLHQNEVENDCIRGGVKHTVAIIHKAFKGMRLNRELTRPFHENEPVFPGLEDHEGQLHWVVFENTPPSMRESIGYWIRSAYHRLN